MATTKIPKSEIEKIIKLTPENLEKINLMGVPIEAVHDQEIELEVLPNRPDCLSIQGYLRALKLYMQKSTPQQYKINQSDYKIIVDKSVENIRQFSMAAVVKGVEFTENKIKEIMHWQEKVHSTLGRNRKKVALGYYILDKIKFPVRFLAKSPKDIVFAPLDMPEKMDALKILSRHPCGREFKDQLAGFDKFPVYYDSNNEVLSLPPIINSNNSGKITQGTSHILIECSGFDLSILKKAITLSVVDLIDQGGKAYAVEIVYGKK